MIINEEDMANVLKCIKERVPSITYTTITARDIYKRMAITVNRHAIKQRNWKEYLVDLGGNGRHRNIRKAIRLMANSKHPRINIVINDISNIDDIDIEIIERDMTPINKWLMQIPMSDKGPERGISHDFTINTSSKL